jgi:hypothetical protein
LLLRVLGRTCREKQGGRNFAEFAFHTSRRYVEHLFDWFHSCFPFIFFSLLHLRGSPSGSDKVFLLGKAEIAVKTRQVFNRVAVGDAGCHSPFSRRSCLAQIRGELSGCFSDLRR